MSGRGPSEGWHGWDAYAPFYDWENRRTVGRRDVRFWTDLASRADGTVLELGCGTGRLSIPVARAAPRFIGIDRSEPMLRRLRTRMRRARLVGRMSVLRGDIRELPFLGGWRCRLAMAPYGMLQSLLSDDDLNATLDGVARVRRARRQVRRRPRARPAAVGGVPQPREPRWAAERRAPGHADRVGAPGPPPVADGLRSGVRRTARRPPDLAPVLARVPHRDRGRGWSSASRGRGSGSTPCWATTRGPRGLRTPRCGSSWPGASDPPASGRLRPVPVSVGARIDRMRKSSCDAGTRWRGGSRCATSL